ncbi:AlbA family DNA-binding domain-containing protein [Robertmurraya sp. P23]|uniref:AlbA family DNA-binding domain-containing protein n=1 Tax=Robertmurraya sp. P23 TaxID=3436931 RepID=UPI003D9861F9
MNMITELIESGHECEYIDYKEKQYSKEKHRDLLVDIMAMANSRYEGDKFIIIGIKDKPNFKEIKGINPIEFIDSSTYTQVVLSNIEPEIEFDYFKYEYKGALLGVFRIYNNDNKPYMIKRKYNDLKEGLCLVRKGSVNSVATRNDFDRFYRNKGDFEVEFLEKTLYGVHDSECCASIEVLLSNNKEHPITITSGTLSIYNKDGEELSKHSVNGIDSIVGADFKIGLKPKSEIVGQLFVTFSSTDPLRLGIDEYGVSNFDYIFKLSLFDARGSEYTASLHKGNVFVKGDFLWKVKGLMGIPHDLKK